MSWFTALSLSFNNLRTKLARTLLTSFAGSIGIIGIALIMSLSTGFQKYIDKIQADTLSNYPLTLQTETTDMAAALAALGTSMAETSALPSGEVGEQKIISSMFSQYGKEKALEYLSSTKVVAIDAETAERLQDAGREPDMVTSGCDIQGMFKAIKESL